MAATNKTGNNKAKSSGSKSSSGQRASNTSSRGKNTANNQYTKERKAAARAALNDEDDGPSRKNEIYVFIYLAVAVFLICSNFGWCGVIGDFISKILFGLVGTVSYILPLYIFLSAAFLFSNGAHKKVIKRVLCVAIFIIALAFICQLINGADGETVKSLYKNGSLNKQGGGVLLGGLVVILHKLIGFTGCVIVTVLLIIIGIIVVMDVSIIDSMKARMVSFEDDDGDQDDEYIDKDNIRFQGENPYYAFSQSGSAELVVFRLFKNDYDKKDKFELSESVAGQVRGKRIGNLLIKSGDDHRAWRIGRIRDALTEASGSMLFTGACGIGDTDIGKMTWVTAIVSDMDNPNNSYGSSKNKTSFQRR